MVTLRYQTLRSSSGSACLTHFRITSAHSQLSPVWPVKERLSVVGQGLRKQEIDLALNLLIPQDDIRHCSSRGLCLYDKRLLPGSHGRQDLEPTWRGRPRGYLHHDKRSP